MPTLREYEDIFAAVADPIGEMEYKNMKEARHIVALQNSACIKKRIELTGDITKAWREGYVKLKGENDQMQKDLVAAFKSAIQMNYEGLGDMAEALQK